MLGAAVCGAQTTVNGGRDYKGALKASGTVSSVDFSGAGSTAPVKAGTLASRPANCTQGQVYFATDATAGQNLSFCTTTGSPGTWSAMTGGGGSTGASVSYCAPASASGSAYTCAPSPAITSYAAGVTVALVPDVSGTGGATTLNVNGLGAKPVKLADGSTNPASADLTAGRLYFLTYDGTQFRLARVIQTKTATSHQFLTAINADGSVSATQPAASDVSGLATSATTDTTSATNVTTGTLADARLSSNVPLKNGTNTMTGYNDLSAASWRPPEMTFAGLPSASTVPGRVYVVTDAGSAGSCTSGGGAARTLCRSTGSIYEALGGGSGGGGGTVTSSGVTYCAASTASSTTYACSPSVALAAYTPGSGIAFVPDVNGAGGAMTLNVSGLGARSIKLIDGTTNPSQIELQAGKLVFFTYDGTSFRMPVVDNCVTGSITLSSVLTANALTQEVTILAAGLPGDFIPSNAWVNIATAATFTSTLTASMGRTGSSTNAEWVPAIDAKQVQAWGDKPTPAVFGVNNTYTALVVNFTGGTALGNGTTSNVTGGTVAWGFCGKRSLQ
jgi:hypothetical protein